MKRIRRNKPSTRTVLPNRQLPAVTGGVWLDLGFDPCLAEVRGGVQAARESARLILREDEIFGVVEA